MDAKGQNLGGAERSREEMLLAEVRRLQSQLDAVLAECKKALTTLRCSEDRYASEYIDGNLSRVLRIIEGGAT